MAENNTKQEFYSILTKLGKIKEMKCLNGEGPYDIWEIAVGDGNGSHYEPEENQTALKNECWRGPVAACENEDETRYAVAHIPASVGGFTIREIGAFDKAGNLLIIGKCAANEKKLPETGDIKQVSYRVDLSVINELVLPYIIDPSINTASVKYVEKHFQALNEKSKPNGYAPLNNEAKVPLEHLPSTFIPFCFNSGPVNENGEAALLKLSTVIETVPETLADTSETELSENIVQADAVTSDSNDTSNTQATSDDNSLGTSEEEEPVTIEKKIITLKSPAVYTDGNGKTITITEDLTLDVTNFTPGKTYSLRVQETNSGTDFDAIEDTKVYRQKDPPSNPNNGDLWQNLSVAPYLSYIYLSSLNEDLEPIGSWQITNQVEAGTYTVPAITQNPDSNSNSDSNSGGGGVN